MGTYTVLEGIVFVQSWLCIGSYKKLLKKQADKWNTMTGLRTAILVVYQQEFHEEINSKNNDVERLTKILQHEPKSPGGPRQYGRYESPLATQNCQSC